MANNSMLYSKIKLFSTTIPKGNKMIPVEYKILDPRIGKTIELASYVTKGSAAMDLRAVFEGGFGHTGKK